MLCRDKSSFRAQGFSHAFMNPPKPEFLSSIHKTFVVKTGEIKEILFSFTFLNLVTLSMLETLCHLQFSCQTVFHQGVNDLNHNISDKLALLRQIHNAVIWLSSLLGNDRL